MADTKDILTCPACGQEMEKIDISGTEIAVDVCTNGCGGMFFDNRELEKFDESHENAENILNSVENKEFAKTDEDKTRICPVCGQSMVKIGACNGIIKIDVCNFCGGKFLDNNELTKIRNTNPEMLDSQILKLIEDMYSSTLYDISGKYSNITKFSSNMGNNFVAAFTDTFFNIDKKLKK